MGVWFCIDSANWRILARVSVRLRGDSFYVLTVLATPMISKASVRVCVRAAEVITGVSAARMIMPSKIKKIVVALFIRMGVQYLSKREVFVARGGITPRLLGRGTIAYIRLRRIQDLWGRRYLH